MQIDWSDPDTLTGLLGGILGLGVGIGAPLFYISRDRADEKKLEELRELNRQTFKETGQYLTEVLFICFSSNFASGFEPIQGQPMISRHGPTEAKSTRAESL